MKTWLFSPPAVDEIESQLGHEIHIPIHLPLLAALDWEPKEISTTLRFTFFGNVFQEGREQPVVAMYAAPGTTPRFRDVTLAATVDLDATLPELRRALLRPGWWS